MKATIRPARLEDATGITQVHIDSWRTTYKGLVPDEHLANLSYEQGTERRIQQLSNPRPNSFTFVAEDERGQIVGFISGGPEREDDPLFKSELYAIYILQEYQGFGIGHHLTQALVESLLAAGFANLLVWVLDTNPARQFYEALGGQYLHSKPIEIGGAQLTEVAYGWGDMRVMLT